IKRFVIDLSVGYCNLADGVIAPSESVAAILKGRGVETPIDVVPTGIDLDRFGGGNGSAIREELGIPANAFVVGHVGRLAEEKNLVFLSEAVSAFLRKDGSAHVLIAGAGPLEAHMRRILEHRANRGRVHFL